MTDHTGGKEATNYVHRRRPENYEEDDQVGSEAEDVEVLKARGATDNHLNNDDEEDRLHQQDLELARTLRLRAEGLEKVVTSMLDQPPHVHHLTNDDFATAPASPRIMPASGSLSTASINGNPNPHTLPNGVRLRLALGTVINDLFARQAPHAPYRHQTLAAAGDYHHHHHHHGHHHHHHHSEVEHLPRALATLRTISASALTQNTPNHTNPNSMPPTPTFAQHAFQAQQQPSV